MVFSKKANIAQWKREAWYARAWFRPRKACAPEEIHAKQRPRGNWWRGNCQHVYYMSFLRRCNAKTFFFANIISSNLLLMLKSRTGSQKLKWILLWKHGPYDLAVCFNFPDQLFNLIWTAMLCVDCTVLDRPHKNEKGWGCSGRRGLGCIVFFGERGERRHQYSNGRYGASDCRKGEAEWGETQTQLGWEKHN